MDYLSVLKLKFSNYHGKEKFPFEGNFCLWGKFFRKVQNINIKDHEDIVILKFSIENKNLPLREIFSPEGNSFGIPEYLCH